MGSLSLHMHWSSLLAHLVCVEDLQCVGCTEFESRDLVIPLFTPVSELRVLNLELPEVHFMLHLSSLFLLGMGEQREGMKGGGDG